MITMNVAGELKDLMVREPRWTLAVAESLTCGHVQACIGSVSGASSYLLGGVTAYTLEQKVKLLGVDRTEAEACDCVAQAIAEQMAAGACRLFGSDVALATTGYAEPDLAKGVRVPMAWWALWHELGGGRAAVRSGLIELPGAARTQVQEAVAAAALGQLVVYLRGLRRAAGSDRA